MYKEEEPVWCVSSFRRSLLLHICYFCLLYLLMELPVTNSGDRKTQYRIKTKNLSYKLRLRDSKLGRFGWWEEPHNRNKYILRNVSCEAKPGEVTAIAGPSGAGKTTLLDILAGMITRVSGHVLVNDQLMNAAHFRRVSGYVTQDEALFPFSLSKKPSCLVPVSGSRAGSTRQQPESES